MGVLEPLGLSWMREGDVVKVNRWRFPDGWTVSIDTIVSVPLTTVESDPGDGGNGCDTTGHVRAMTTPGSDYRIRAGGWLRLSLRSGVGDARGPYQGSLEK
jgi:hypothetical protein